MAREGSTLAAGETVYDVHRVVLINAMSRIMRANRARSLECGCICMLNKFGSHSFGTRFGAQGVLLDNRCRVILTLLRHLVLG